MNKFKIFDELLLGEQIICNQEMEIKELQRIIDELREDKRKLIKDKNKYKELALGYYQDLKEVNQELAEALLEKEDIERDVFISIYV